MKTRMFQNHSAEHLSNRPTDYHVLNNAARSDEPDVVDDIRYVSIA